MIDARQIITSKELNRLSAAQAGEYEIVIDLEYLKAKIRLSTVKAPAVWKQSYIIRVEVWQPGIYSSQYFRSIGEINVGGIQESTALK